MKQQTTVTVSIVLSDSSAGSLSTSSGNGETFSSGTWSISGVSVSVANDALAALFYVPTANYDVDATATISIEDADGLSISDTIILDVVPINETPSATEMDQTLSFDEDSSDNALTAIVISEVDTIQANTDSTTASDDATSETVSVTITASDTSAGAFSTGTGSGESFSSGVWSISDVSVSKAILLLQM